MTEPGTVVAGIVGKPHGVKGEVLVLPGDADVLVPGAVFETERGALTVSAVRRHHGRLILGFEGITDRTAAETLRGLSIRIPLADAPLPDEEWWPDDLIGCRVVLADGTVVGTVLGVAQGAAQDRLVVGVPDPVEIPFVRELVPDVDVVGRTVTIAPPDGLLDP